MVALSRPVDDRKLERHVELYREGKRFGGTVCTWCVGRKTAV